MNNLACNDSQVVPVVIQPVQSVRSELLSGYPDLLKVHHIAEITGHSIPQGRAYAHLLQA